MIFTHDLEYFYTLTINGDLIMKRRKEAYVYRRNIKLIPIIDKEFGINNDCIAIIQQAMINLKKKKKKDSYIILELPSLKEKKAFLLKEKIKQV